MEERETESQPVTEYVIDLKERLEAVGDQLRGQQYVVRQDQTKKPSPYLKGSLAENTPEKESRKP